MHQIYRAFAAQELNLTIIDSHVTTLSKKLIALGDAGADAKDGVGNKNEL